MWHLAYAYGQEERDKEAQHFFELAYPTLQTQVEFLKRLLFLFIKLTKRKAILILNQLLEIDPSNENWHDESMIANISW